jgi:hypothetical protein
VLLSAIEYQNAQNIEEIKLIRFAHLPAKFVAMDIQRCPLSITQPSRQDL